MRTIAILCAAKKSAYKSIPGLDVYDEARDARTFTGGMPVIAHPPCRTWSKHCRHQVVAEPRVVAAEQELGIWCADQVKINGGILEQPAGSLLWKAANLPMPGHVGPGNSFSHHVWQAWWGYSMKKATWLYFSGINQLSIELPFVLHQSGNDRRAFQLMSKSRRSETVPAFAEWLVSLARQSNVNALRGE